MQLSMYDLQYGILKVEQSENIPEIKASTIRKINRF